MTTAAHQGLHRRFAPTTPSAPRAPQRLRDLPRRSRPALTGAAFGAVVGVLLASGGMDPVAALTAGSGLGLAAGLLVPVPAPPADDRPAAPEAPADPVRR